MPNPQTREEAIAAVPAVSALEYQVADNLRQPSLCGKDHIRLLLDDAGDETRKQLAEIVAFSGTRGIRQNEAAMKHQLQAEADRAETLRAALDVFLLNPPTSLGCVPDSLRGRVEKAVTTLYGHDPILCATLCQRIGRPS